MTITATITMAAMMAGMAGAIAHGAEPQQNLTVQLRNHANAPAMVLIPAKALASEMFAKIGISLEWSNREPADQLSQPPIFIDLVTGTPETRMPGALAYALPFEGSHIIVFYDRVNEKPCPHKVLGHVMVHEITHLLQGVNRHSSEGVMKARWTGTDFCDMRLRPLPFTSDDVRLIYAGLVKSTAGTRVLVAQR